jgi:hypothetical protein
MEAQNKPTVTKEWLAKKIQENPNKTIGRALAAIYNNQTSSDQASTSTRHNNGIGFSKPDARVGSIGARMFHAHGSLQKWVVDIWSRPAKDGYPRICKYANQLQYIAEAKSAVIKETHPKANLVIL